MVPPQPQCGLVDVKDCKAGTNGLTRLLNGAALGNKLLVTYPITDFSYLIFSKRLTACHAVHLQFEISSNAFGIRVVLSLIN
jgi:hypothetical protein